MTSEAAISSQSAPPPSWPSYLLAFAATSITVGIMWDISWHETIGRDTFWTPAHLAIYLGGALGGCIGGWLAIQHTFLAGPVEKASSVKVFGARAPLGAWIVIWGATAMLTAGPFDNWWHNAYGLDVKIISPPHALLGLGMFGITFGALITVLTRQNRLGDGKGSGLFIYVGGLFLVMAGVFVMEYVFPNAQHAGQFYLVCALTFPFRLISLGRAGRTSWPATKVAAVYILVVCLMIWVLQLFPAHPRLAPIFNPVTHMVTPPFPLLLIIPAFIIDLILYKTNEVTGWKLLPLAVVLGAVFLALFVPTQWLFSSFLLSPMADNEFFSGSHVWGYNNEIGPWTKQFWNIGDDPIRAQTLKWGLGFAAFTSWLGLLLGGWMRKVQR